MGKTRQTLIYRELDRVTSADDFPERAAAALAACPEAASISDAEAEDFLMVVHYLETVSHETICRCMRRAGMVVPPEISLDEYRLSRHIFRRWSDPQVRSAIISRGVQMEEESFARFLRKRDPAEVRQLARQFTAPVFFALMRKYGAPELIQIVLADIPEEGLAHYRNFLIYTRTLMHRFMTEPEPPRRPTHWDRAKLARRLQLREVQMRAMRKSVHHLRRERKALMTRLRESSQQENPELQALAARLAALRAERAEVEHQFASERAARTRQYQAMLDGVRAELTQLQHQAAAGLAERQVWLSPGKERLS